MSGVEDPSELLDLLEADREAHLYALGDLEEPYWSHSHWFRRGDAAVGLISTGGGWATGYAMSRLAPTETLALFAEVQDRLTPHSWVTGALGLHDTVSQVRSCRTIGPHWRMILDEPRLIEHDLAITELGASDVEALSELHSAEPGRAFWLVGMLSANPFVGLWEGERLLASAGCHVASERYGVAAIGAVFTHPDVRGRGLGAAVTSELLRRLHGRFETIGLNVEVGNKPAIRIYDRLGFRQAFQYEEIELL